MKSRKLIVPFIITASLTLAACGGANDTNKTTETKTTVSISDGAKEMKQNIADLKGQLTADDAKKVKKSGAKLEDTWRKFEDDVKAKDADLYEKVETPLHTIEAGAKVQPLDVQTLNKAADELDTVLSDVGKLK